MSQQELIAGTNRDKALSAWFTPPKLAERVVEWALQEEYALDRDPMRVLEPSAGNGALVRPLLAAGAQVHAIELDLRYRHELESVIGVGGKCPCDFLRLQCAPNEFDLCVMNPPYEDGQDVQFILHALKFAPRVVGIFRSALLHGAQRKRELWSQVRPTRIAFLSERPQFDESGGSARSDFVVLELVRSTPEGYGRVTPSAEDVNCEWW